MSDSPLRQRHEAYVAQERKRGTSDEVAAARPGAARGRRGGGGAVQYIDYGPAAAGEAARCRIVSSFGTLESEYAAIRNGVGMMDGAQRGTLRVSGADRADFLSRLTSQKLDDLADGEARATFRLNRRGRIEADLLCVELGGAILIDLDVHQAPSTAAALEACIFTEDVQVEPCSGKFHHIALHGPAAPELFAQVADPAAAPGGPLRAVRARVAGEEVVAARRDQTGSPGLELFVARAGVGAVWDALLAAADPARRQRPVGWQAFNVARIEAGTPLFNIDFGTTNLPHESGVLRERVSFAKGCYPGQELVARIENLGRPKAMLAGLRVEEDRLPVAGAAVAEDTGRGPGAPVGAVTSSTLSPMLGAHPVAFAMLRTACAAPGTRLLVEAEGRLVKASAGPLRFWPPAATP